MPRRSPRSGSVTGNATRPPATKSADHEQRRPRLAATARLNAIAHRRRARRSSASGVKYQASVSASDQQDREHDLDEARRVRRRRACAATALRQTSGNRNGRSGSANVLDVAGEFASVRLAVLDRPQAVAVALQACRRRRSASRAASSASATSAADTPQCSPSSRLRISTMARALAPVARLDREIAFGVGAHRAVVHVGGADPQQAGRRSTITLEWIMVSVSSLAVCRPADRAAARGRRRRPRCRDAPEADAAVAHGVRSRARIRGVCGATITRFELRRSRSRCASALGDRRAR